MGSNAGRAASAVPAGGVAPGLATPPTSEREAAENQREHAKFVEASLASAEPTRGESLDESFESAVPVDVRSFAAERGGDEATPAAVARAALPSVESVAEKIPAENLRALEQLFHARLTTVRRIPPEQRR